MLCLKRNKFKFIGLSCSIFLAILGSAQPAHPQEGWKQRWDRTLKAAKKEGQVVVYISNYEPAVAPFRKAHPEIKLIVVQDRGTQLMTRILAERRARKFVPDVVSAGALNYNILYKGRALDPIKPTLVLPEILDQSKWWRGKHIYVDPEASYVLAYVGYPSTPFYYNTKLVHPSEIKSHWDLLHPKWKGKMISYDPRIPVVAGALQFLYHSPELGPEFMRQFFGGTDITFSRNFRQMVDWLAKGKFSICFACRGARRAKMQGLPVNNFDPISWKEGAYLTIGGGSLSVLKGAPHPNAATVFINWYLSRKGQMALQNLGRPDDPPNSLRNDIPKDVIFPEHKRLKGEKYFVVHRPELADVTPIFKLTKQILGKRK